MHSNAKNGTKLVLVLLTILVFLALNGRSLAQGNGTIVGVVHDETNAAIASATIAAPSSPTASIRLLNGCWTSPEARI